MKGVDNRINESLQTRPDQTILVLSMPMLNISEAKANLSSVIERVVTRGEECLIGKAGKPVAKIVPYEPSRRPRRLGLLKGKVRLDGDWDVWPQDIARTLGIKSE